MRKQSSDTFVKKSHHQRGAALVEYALAVGFLIGVFIVGGIALREAAGSRSRASIGVSSGVHGMAPCYVPTPGEKPSDLGAPDPKNPSTLRSPLECL